MSAINNFKATELAVDIVVAAATGGHLKLDGVPLSAEQAATAGEKDGTYIAALVTTIAAKLKTV